MNNIHSSSYISEKATISKDAHIGPFCYIGDDVVIESGVKLHSHVVINCKTVIGSGTEIFPFASINQPQDLKFSGEQSEVIIGKNNKIREHATIHSGTAAGGLKTIVGDNCLLMVGTHIAHDCIVGNGVIMANNATLGGHVIVGDGAIIGGLAAIHQKVRIGKGAIVGGMSGVERDVLPYGSVRCDRAFLDGLNIVGLRRASVNITTIKELSQFFDLVFFDSKTDDVLSERIKNARAKYKNNPLVNEVIDFINADSSRSICVAK